MGNKMESCNSEQNSKKNLSYSLADIFAKKKIFFSVFFYKKMEDELKKYREEKERELYIPLPHFPLGIKKCQNP